MITLWVASLRTKIFNLIKEDIYEDLAEEYSDIFFTTSDKTATTSKFPTVYIDLASMVENGETTEISEVNSMLMTIEVKVMSNNSSTEALYISNVIMRTMKKLLFDTVSFPIASISGENLYQASARYRRNIASEDTLELS